MTNLKTLLTNSACIYTNNLDAATKNLISGVVYKYQCNLCNEYYYGKSITHLDIRSGDHIGLLYLTAKKTKPSTNSTICDHLLHCKFLPSHNNRQRHANISY